MPDLTERLDRILEAATSLESLFWTAKPTLNLAALDEAQSACARMRGVDATIDAQADEIAPLLPVFFSLQRHNAYPGGAEGLRERIIRELLPRIRLRARALKNR